MSILELPKTHMNSVISELNMDQGGIIAFVGAGGKTTLMLKIASELSRIEKDILITTTTKIMPPAENLAANLIVAGSRGRLGTGVTVRRSGVGPGRPAPVGPGDPAVIRSGLDPPALKGADIRSIHIEPVVDSGDDLAHI